MSPVNNKKYVIRIINEQLFPLNHELTNVKLLSYCLLKSNDNYIKSLMNPSKCV